MNTSQPYVLPLGVAAALPRAGYENSYLTVVREGRYWLVDCAGSPIPRIQQAGLDPLAVQGVIITHFHPDHVYGLPAFLLGLYILQSAEGQAREGAAPLPIYARPEVLDRVRALAELFAHQAWLGTLPLAYRAIEVGGGEQAVRVAETEDFTISAVASCHSAPSIALRFALPGAEGRAFVYSSDTEPCAAVTALAQGAALLFHEATDADDGHTRPRRVGEIATEAGAARLGLIHYRTTPDAMAHALSEARATFDGPVELAEALKRYLW